MSKLEYLEALREKLQRFNGDLQKEILEDYEEHFTEGAALGKTEEQIIEELGNIDDMIEEISEEELKQELSLSGEERDQKFVTGGEYRQVVLDGLVADITVSESMDGQIHVEYHNQGGMVQQQRYQFYQREENGVFYAGVERNTNVDMADDQKSFRFEIFGRKIFSFGNLNDYGSGSIYLEVQLPSDIPCVEVKTMSGDIHIMRLHTKNLKINVTSGDIDLKSVTAESVKINSTSGDVNLENLTVSEWKIQATSGDIYGENIKVKRVTGGTGSGDLDLEIVCAECEFTTGSGDIRMKAAGSPERIRLNTGSGDVSLELEREEDLVVTVGTGSGDGVICMNGSRHEVSGRSYTMGSGSRQVTVGTGSGDAEVVCGW